MPINITRTERVDDIPLLLAQMEKKNMAALATSAYVAAHRDHYLCPLPAVQMQQAALQALPLQVIVNPTLSIIDPAIKLFFEGCLSVAGFTALVPRATKVRVEGLDEKGGALLIEAEGWHARILQHEIDHLYGKLYLDSMLPRSFMTAANHARFWTFGRTRPFARFARLWGWRRHCLDGYTLMPFHSLEK
jgi:peptide deformylase